MVTLKSKIFGATALCAALISSFPALAQGTIFFDNRNLQDPSHPGRYNAQVSLPDGTFADPFRLTAGLFIVDSGSLTLIATRPIGRNGIISPDVIRVDGISWGQPATVRVRVWETSASSYENAIASGFLYGEFPTGQPNNDLLLPILGGDPFDNYLPAVLNGLQPFSLVPEPTTCAILALGGFLCFSLFKRK